MRSIREAIRNAFRPGRDALPHQQPPRVTHGVVSNDVAANRKTVADRFLNGAGLEIGALHNPLAVPEGVQVRYVDRFSVRVLRKHYPELNDLPLVDPDIVDDGETLSIVASDSQDFVIANHFIEHCEDPIKAIGNFLRVLKSGGVLYMAIPDKDKTFDIDRPITPFSHLMRDHQQGPQWSRRDHFIEWSQLVDHVAPGEEVGRADWLMEKNYSIHFHVWDKPAIFDLVANLRVTAGLAFTIIMFLNNGEEAIIVLSK